jgi:PhnB protein
MTKNEFIPYLSVTDAAGAVGFYQSVFEAEPVNRLEMPDGRLMHCEFHVGGARIYLSEELPEHGGTPSPRTLGATSVAIHFVVGDCDAVVGRMKDHGAEVLMEPEDMFWGDRFARVRDPFGHEWGITQHLEDMTPEQIRAEAEKLFGGEEES